MSDLDSASSLSSLPFTQSQGTIAAVSALAVAASRSSSSSGSGRSRQQQIEIELPENSRIVQPSYLEKQTNKKDLIRRLHNLVQVLRHDESIEPDNTTEWPGLQGTAQYLVTHLIHHKDKEIRLYAVLACMEILTIYAPDVPGVWDKSELIDIFQQTVRQLGNLAHTTDPLKQPNFLHYSRILELFAQVKIGCIMVDLAQQDDGGIVDNDDERIRDDDNDSKSDGSEHDHSENNKIRTPSKRRQSRLSYPTSTMATSTTVTAESRTTPLEIVIDLIHTLLHCVRNEHPVEILDLVQHAIIACLDEYNPDHGAPFPVGLLDELLLCIGQGPTIWVTNAAAHQELSKQQQQQKQQVQSKRGNPKASAMKDHQQLKLPLQVEQTNPTYVIAAAVTRSMLNKLATPIAQLLNGLLNGVSYILEQSTIRCPTSSSHNLEQSSLASPVDPSGVVISPTSESTVDVYSIVYELHRVAPQILTTVIGNVSNGLRSMDTAKRSGVTTLLGRLFSASSTSSPGASSSSFSSSGAAMPFKNVTSTNGGTMASKFRACYREWLTRHCDVEASIRKSVVKHCVAILSHHEATDPVVCHEASETIIKCLQSDPSLDVRLEAIHSVTDWVYRQNQASSNKENASANIVSPSLLRAVGSRCSSKSKQERRDAITALSKIYVQHYLTVQLKSVISGGDDCPVGVIRDVFHRVCHVATGEQGKTNSKKDEISPSSTKQRKKRSNPVREWSSDDKNSMDKASNDDEERYAWIPSKVFECLYYTDQSDPEMRSRIFQIIDEVLLGYTSWDKQKLASTSSRTTNATKSKMTPTARAVGLAIIFDSIRNDGTSRDVHSHQHLLLGRNSSTSNAFKYMRQFLQCRSKLQRTICNYMDTRSSIRECETGTEEAMAAEAKAMELLELAALSNPIIASGPSAPSLEDVLTSFHGARDKHIFRLLATVAHSNHTMQARLRALDELPKRTKSLGDGVSDWVRNLVKRCAMSDFFNAEIIHHCVLLAKECFDEDDVSSMALLLSCVKTAVEIFPSIAGSEETFSTLTDLFSDCRQEANSEVRNELESHGVVTCLSSILSAASIAKPVTIGKSAKGCNADELHEHLMKLCTKDGSPEEARNAVYTLSRILSRGSRTDEAVTFAANSHSGFSQTSDEQSVDLNIEAFEPLLRALTSPTKLTTTINKSGSTRIISTLSALSALSDCAPFVIASSNNGRRALKFASESVLMGREATKEDDDDGHDVEDNDSSADSELEGTTSLKTPTSSKRKVANCSPAASSNILENESLSVHCRRICAALDFLVSYIRSVILLRFRQSDSKSKTAASYDLGAVEAEAKSLFELLAQILRDKGLPPSSRDRRHCKSRHERAAMRQCAALCLLRLSDARLGLEKKHLSHSMWHLLSEAVLDEEIVVREAVLEELSSFLTGSGIYGIDGSKLPPKAPSLRFLSLVALCSDGDHGSDNDMANGGAANVGKTSLLAKNAAHNCIVNLRKVADASYAQSRALGKEAEKRFETQFKMLVMPEYAVPYAFHLLSHRRETPSAGGISTANAILPSQEVPGNSDIEPIVVTDESQQRVLRKRLKLLFEPLVQSLGDGADNISFLLRMTEILGKHFMPIDVSRPSALPSLSSRRLSVDSVRSVTSDRFTPNTKDYPKTESRKSEVLEAKLKTICSAAREVLLSFVKKDVNLSSYPGTIQLPSSLFARTDRGLVRILAPVQKDHDKSGALSVASSEESSLSGTPETHRATKQSSESDKPSSFSKMKRNARKSPSEALERSQARKSRSTSPAHDDNCKSLESSPSTRKRSANSISDSKNAMSTDSKNSRKSPRVASLASTRSSTSKGKASNALNSEQASRLPISEEPHSAVKSNDGSSRKGHVHFSPKLENIKVANDFCFLSGESQDDSCYVGDLSPIAKSSSPVFFKNTNLRSSTRNSDRSSSSSLPTLGTTPPSALRSHTFPSIAAEGETAGDEASPGLSTKVQSPHTRTEERKKDSETLASMVPRHDSTVSNKKRMAQEENAHQKAKLQKSRKVDSPGEESAYDEFGKELSETSVSSPQSNLTMKSPDKMVETTTRSVRNSNKNGLTVKGQKTLKVSSIPQQIKLNLSKGSLSSTSTAPALRRSRDNKKKHMKAGLDDFDFDFNEENLPVSKNQAVADTKKSKKAATAQPKPSTKVARKGNKTKVVLGGRTKPNSD